MKLIFERSRPGRGSDILPPLDVPAAPLPEELDQTQPVALVSYDSREVVPGTLFVCKGAHFKP